jgi:putative endonuclease
MSTPSPDYRQRGRKNRQRGRTAEFLARLYFFFHGWKIIQKNLRLGRGTHAGEIDFIARRGPVLAFVEVKERASLEAAAYAVSAGQRKRLIRAAEVYTLRNGLNGATQVRFDVCLVKFPFSIKHIPSAWTL